ncbi:MAG TPA: prepilin-type N-terminal cleavage/methylation domain-containing protein, partial [Planctomycetes bacterium]|nr:prepilin-type N-terminal cleavage/methylation domain-containing protein [Planctomycetota bacterium]
MAGPQGDPGPGEDPETPGRGPGKRGAGTIRLGGSGLQNPSGKPVRPGGTQGGGGPHHRPGVPQGAGSRGLGLLGQRTGLGGDPGPGQRSDRRKGAQAQAHPSGPVEGGRGRQAPRGIRHRARGRGLGPLGDTQSPDLRGRHPGPGGPASRPRQEPGGPGDLPFRGRTPGGDRPGGVRHFPPRPEEAGVLMRTLSRGFTLIELLVVILILGTLMAVLLPRIFATRLSAEVSQCQGIIGQLATIAKTYETDAGDYPPDDLGAFPGRLRLSHNGENDGIEAYVAA